MLRPDIRHAFACRGCSSRLFRIVSSQNRYHSGWFNAKIYNSSSFLFPGLLYPPGAPPLLSLPEAQRLAVVMALPPVTRGLDGYNAGFGGFVALLVEELANGAILIRREDMFPYRIKLVQLNVAK